MDQFGKSQKIVIVEDNVNLAEIYKTRLEILGYQVLVANDGITALTMIEKEVPNLVLLDLMVPKIAGDQILETMRKSDWGREIPVYIISNLNESDAPAGLRGMGIEGYAVKANLSNDQLDALVDSILTPVDQEGTESLETPAEGPSADEPQPDAPAEDQAPAPEGDEAGPEPEEPAPEPQPDSPAEDQAPAEQPVEGTPLEDGGAEGENPPQEDQQY